MIRKILNFQLKSIDEENRRITFCFSDDQKDRMGERVDQGSWKTDSYETNPLILWGHDPSKPENVIGSGVELSLNQDGKSYVTAEFDDEETNPKSNLVYRLLKKGRIRTVSAGFIPHTEEYEDDIPVLKDNELLEISVVPIPANARAVALAYKEGDISEKDARWLMDSMRKEADLMEDTLKSLSNTTEKSMTDEQATALIDAVAGVRTSLDELKAENATLKEELAALKPAVETEDDKAAREAKEQEDANVAAGLNPDGSAKSGTEGDQGGAEEDEFDEDAELTPEQEAELDAQLEETLAELEPAA